MGDFIQIKRKPNKKRLKEEYDDTTPQYFAKLTKKVFAVLEETELESQLNSTLSALENVYSLLGVKTKFSQIICYGLGSISNSKSSLYQFALIHKLSEKLECSTVFFDPVFTPADVKLLQSLNCSTLGIDDKGCHSAEEEEPVLYFLPHSPRFIFNNILRSNWGLQLRNIVILGDNLTTIVDNTPSRIFEADHPFLFASRQFVDVLPVENSFRFVDVFNDFAFHVFVPSELEDVDKQTWDVDTLSVTSEIQKLSA